MSRRFVRDGYDARDQSARPHGEERRRETEELVARMTVGQCEVARREHDHVRRMSQPLELECGERAVGELERGEERAVGPETAVAGDVGERCAVESAQDRIRRRRVAFEHGRRRVDRRELVKLATRMA